LFGLIVLAGCGSPSVALPPTDGAFDYQLGGLADRVPADAVVVVDPNVAAVDDEPHARSCSMNPRM
jgi:hypothetical protein